MLQLRSLVVYVENPDETVQNSWHQKLLLCSRLCNIQECETPGMNLFCYALPFNSFHHDTV